MQDAEVIKRLAELRDEPLASFVRALAVERERLRAALTLAVNTMRQCRADIAEVGGQKCEEAKFLDPAIRKCREALEGS